MITVNKPLLTKIQVKNTTTKVYRKHSNNDKSIVIMILNDNTNII